MDKFVTTSRIDTVFISANSAVPGEKKDQTSINAGNALSRKEFMECIFRISGEKFVNVKPQ
jgi:hypothetical protein